MHKIGKMEMLTLEQKTLAYWNISKSYNGHLDKNITTSRAIKVLNNTLFVLGPNRILRLRINCLLDEIITQDTPRLEATIK